MTDAAPTFDEETLSDLAHKLVDQVALYGVARDIADDPAIADAIQRAKSARAQLLQDINAKIWQGGLPSIEQGANLGSAQKAFVRLKALTNKDDKSALAEVERGEAYLRDRFERASEDERLSAHTRNFLRTMLSKIATTHEEISALASQLS